MGDFDSKSHSDFNLNCPHDICRPSHDKFLETQAGKLKKIKHSDIKMEAKDTLNPSEFKIDHHLKQHRVVAFVKTDCNYCEKAVQLLVEMKLTPFIVEVDQDPDLMHVLKLMTNTSHVPYIFIRERFVGGYDDLLEELNNGKLQQILRETSRRDSAAAEEEVPHA